jgi:hypothetical protein
MPRKIITVVVVYGANQANVQAAQEHSLTRPLDPRGGMEQDKIGACVRPNAALVSRARFRLNGIRLYLSFACAISVKQTAQAPVSEKNRCVRLACSRWVFQNDLERDKRLA